MSALRPRRRLRHLISRLYPREGRRLAPELQSPGVAELAEALPRGVRDPGFPALLSRIDDGAPVHSGNRIDLYFRGDTAFEAMERAIDGAEWEVLLESYIFRDDATGQAIYSALHRAARRGVAVRVLADAFGSFETRSAFWRQVEAAGIETRLFHPLFAKLWYQPYRDHRKILVVDRRVAFTGGMNIADEYGSSTRPRQDVWRDTHARLEGPAAQELAVVFAEGWERADGRPFDASLGPEPRTAGPAQALVLDARPRRGYLESAAILTALVAAARRSVWITNAYFAPGRSAVEVLGRVSARGVDVRLLLQGKSDAALVRHAGHGWFGRLLERGVRIFEYQASILHAKSLVADGHGAVVGSTNLDFRSFRFNAEANLVLLDDGVGASLERAFVDDCTEAVEIRDEEWRYRPSLHRLGDRLARKMSPLL